MKPRWLPIEFMTISGNVVPPGMYLKGPWQRDHMKLLVKDGKNSHRKVHKWNFRARFRRHAFGWRSQPAIKRIKEAVSVIKKESRKGPILSRELGLS